MIWPVIEKPDAGRSARTGVSPNMIDYAAARAAFNWDVARRGLDGLPRSRGLNIAHEAVDRHAAGALRDHEALRFVARDESIRCYTYGELAAQTSRFANVLRRLGVKPGERVFSLLGRMPELYIAALGTLKNASVFCPLFSAFGPEPIRQRLALGDGKVLLTTRAFYERKVSQIRADLPALEHVVLVDDGGGPGTVGLRSLMSDAEPTFEIPPTDPEAMALVHFTSGTTGSPKGAIHVHSAVVNHYATGYFALDLHQDDVFWCTADPGWVTGTSYGIISPLAHGVTTIVDEEDFDADRWYRILQNQRVNVWYTAPTALRMLMKAGIERARGYDLSALRFVASVGSR